MIEKKTVRLAGLEIPVYSLNTVVVGTGAAGLNCACRLFREMEETGVADPRGEIAIVTQGVGLGTSNNSGSDKQTYYKLGTHGSEPDCPVDFAQTLTAGGCAHADVALAEGENSLRGFYRLADIGVPFPHNARGGFVGYKTDHDPRQRATSAGPWTSRFMVQKLLVELKRYKVEIFNRHHVLAVVTAESNRGREACGLLCADLRKQKQTDHGLVLFNCHNVVMAGGGPGDLYEISVYPKGQMGPYAALFEAGVEAHNLTESQFGLASLKPRWNLSGTYQQVIPRYFSTNARGGDPREFLNPWFESMSTLATDIFLKGYQWPFDHDKIADYGSSLIDVVVQNEMIDRGRRVFMDLRENPRATGGLQPFSLDQLAPEALTYLEKSGATQPTPIARLAHMNQPSIDLYKEMGVDLWKEPLEIGICSQHCNGGFAVDSWWESNVARLFVVGELAGTHGVKRPGGSALNSGQVGSLRAAQRIAHVYWKHDLATEDCAKLAEPIVARFAREIARVKEPSSDALSAASVKKEIQRRMSESAGMVRSLAGVEKALSDARAQWDAIRERGLRGPGANYVEAIKVRELALAQIGFLEAIKAVLERGGGSRGSHLVTDPSGRLPHPDLGPEWKYIAENLDLRNEILGLVYDPATHRFVTRATTPNPPPGGEFWFENTWAEYRRATIFRKREDEPCRPYKDYQ
ncbi:FAD-binding protein [Candidatus Sumerlaeota bacterium]|nr:FAD-binding protein [Candidatus Sumerlaeota bacterium]